MKKAFVQNPLLRMKHEKQEEDLYSYLKKRKNNEKQSPPNYVLPVVVHIIHNNGAENISDATVLQGIQDLNDAYANIGYYDPATGVDSKVQFCLAKRDPDGNATSGITRNASTMTDMELETMDIDVKNLNRWDPAHYVNIWLVKEICSSAYGCGVAGYAYFPSSHTMPEDGIMMEAEYFGSSQGASGVQIHEMGHYLGLYHTFQGGCTNNDCLSDGDRACDTSPDQSTAAVPCGMIANSCSTDTDSGFSTDQNDLIEDYMDYGDFNCWSVFTQGQIDRMHFFIENVRSSLLESLGCTDPCTSDLTASFTASTLSLNVGGNVIFTNTSTNTTSANWKLNGTTFAVSTNANYTFNSIGSYEVCLTVGNTDPNCSDKACKTITVNCPVIANFTTSNLYPAPGQPVNFTNTSTSATNYAWKVNGTLAGSTVNLDYSFPSPGLNNICLTAGNGLCTETFCQNVFAFETSGGGECEGSFIKTLGTSTEVENAHKLVATPEGNFLIGGSKGNSSLLILAKPSGELIWQRSFDFTPGDDFIRVMMIDGDGMLVANGRDQLNSATSNFTFRYDYQNNTMLWTRYMPDPAYTRIEGLLQKPGNGNYVFIGMVENPSTSLDNAFIELNKSTGALVNMKTFDSGSTTDVYYGGTVYANSFYLVGNQRYGNLDKIRPSLSKLDLNGNQAWTKIHLRNPNSNARLYAEEIHIENDTAFILGRGNLSSDAPNGFTSQLYTTNLDGNIYWAKNYAIAGGNTMSSRKLIPLANGFIFQGYYTSASGSQDFFFIRTDKQGNVVWAKALGSSSSTELCWTSTYDNGFVYFAANSDFNSSNDNILFGRMTLDGEIAGQGCDFIHDIQVNVTSIDNPYQGQHDLVQSPQSYAQNPATTALANTDLPTNDLSGCACEAFSPACDTSFLRTYGTPFQDERGHAIVEIPAALGGGFLLGGGKGDSAMITRLDINANIVWTRSFDATPDAADFIWSLSFDSDNNVIGSGQTRDEPNNNIECFVFKYNIATNNILWVNELDLNDPAVEIYRSIFEKSPGGNYIVAGDVDQNPGSGASNINGMILELNRNTGANVWQHNYTLGSAESFQKTILHNGSTYTTGRYNFDAAGTARMRPGITKMDLNGVQQWSKLYLKAVNTSTTARLLSSDMVADNGLVVLGHGDNTGTSTTNVTEFLFKTDNDGNLLWAMNYDIPGATSEVTTQLLNLPDGYIGLGYYTAASQDVFIFKTDKQGQLQWSKSYGNAATEDAFDLTLTNGQIYFIGKTKANTPGATNDLYLADIGLDGTTNSLDSCNLFSDLNMTASPFANPYSAQHNLTDLGQTWGQFLNDKIVTETAVQTTTVCFQPCLDSCDVVPNALFQSATATCLGDSLSVSLSLCNLGNFDLPLGTPIRFYLGNPTSTTAVPVGGSFSLPQSLAKDSCGTFNFMLLASPNTTIYVMLNDDGTNPTPFSLTSFEADIEECNYVNNLGSFNLNFTAPTLELGPDIVSCATGVTELDAGPGFASYHWQDGSSEQTLTAFAPGTYSVTVTDACGGTQADQVHISSDPATAIDLGPDQTICNGGSYDFNLTGFATYEWAPADYLSCTDCPNPTTTPTANITYTLVATTADGCIAVDSIQFSVAPVLESFEDAVLCNGDTLMVFGMPITTNGQFSQTFTSVSGCDSIHTISVGLLPVVESFEDALLCQGDTLIVFGMPITTNGQFSQTFTSANGCDSIRTISVGLLIPVATQENISICHGETVDVFGTQVGITGDYSMSFMGFNGCDSTHTIHLKVDPEISLVYSIVNPICFGGSTGSANISAVGGSGNGTPASFNYQWQYNGTAIGGNTPTLTNLTAGNYIVTVTDSEGCTASSSIQLTQPTAVQSSIANTNTSCNVLGTATVTASGGTGALSFHWSNNETTASIDSLTAGTYSVTVTDANNCTSVSTTSILGSLGPGVNISIVNPVTEDEPNGGELTASAAGGVAPYDFDWSNAEATAHIDSLSAGTYTVTVTDANGCTATATVYLFVPACTGGKIWNDMDRDGCQDPGETGIGNVQLMLSGTSIYGQTVADTTISAINGEYIFLGLAPGNYFVKIKLPAGRNLSQPNACNDTTSDSDFNTTTQLSGVIVLVEGHCCLTIDGGLFDACLNIITTGEICCDQTLCGPGNDPAPINSVVPASGGGGATQYAWMYSTVGGPMGSNWAVVPGAFGPSYDPGPLSQTTHFVRCAKSATCIFWLESNVVTITVDDEAVAHINSPGPVCINHSVTFTAAPNGAGATYAWNFGPWATPSSSNQASVTVTFGQAGVTNVSLTVIRNGCTSTDAMAVNVSSNPAYCSQSIALPGGGGTNAALPPSAQATADGRFSVFPNPFSNDLTVAWGEDIQSVVSVKLFSVEGKLLQSGESISGELRYTTDLSRLVPGIYLLRLQAEDGEMSVFRLVKE